MVLDMSSTSSHLDSNEGDVCHTRLRSCWFPQRGSTKDGGDVRKLLTVITSVLMTDPFSLDENDHVIAPLVNITTAIMIVLQQACATPP